MYHRFHGSKPKRGNTSGKWQRMPHSGVGTVHQETDGDWEICVNHRRAGGTIRRDVFGVTIRTDSPAHEEYLAGFSSKSMALAAARKRIGMLQAIRERAQVRRIVQRREVRGSE